MSGTVDIISNNNDWPDKYFQTLSLVVTKPRLFFQAMPPELQLSQPLKFLFISSAIMTGASLTQAADNTLLMAFIKLLNALGMPFITAGVAFPLVLLLMGRSLNFTRVFSIYAYAGGVVVLVAWLPAFTWFAESVRWVLIGIGLVHGIQMSRPKALLVIVISIAITAILLTGLAAVIR